MKIRAVLSDFDLTFVSRSMLTYLAGLVGKEKESERLNDLFYQSRMSGVDSLIHRINLLKGLEIERIRVELEKQDFVRNGGAELIRWLKKKGIVFILVSGNVEPLLEIYKQKYGIDHIIASRPKVLKGRIEGISRKDYPEKHFRTERIMELLGESGISERETVAMGDSIADLKIFELAGKSIAVNPSPLVARKADFVIRDDLSRAIPIIQGLILEK
jgi:phosphoserine phosphatase